MPFIVPRFAAGAIIAPTVTVAIARAGAIHQTLSNKNRRTASLNTSGRSRFDRCPAPGIFTSEPRTRTARSSDNAGGVSVSSAPTNTRDGMPSLSNRGRASGQLRRRFQGVDDRVDRLCGRDPSHVGHYLGALCPRFLADHLGKHLLDHVRGRMLQCESDCLIPIHFGGRVVGFRPRCPPGSSPANDPENGGQTP